MYLKYILCLIILLVATIWDLEYRRIPNELTAVGVFLGLFWDWSLYGFFCKLLSLFLIFCIGYFRLMGMGDLKLWMMITSFVGLENSIIILGFAALYLCAYAFLKNTQEARMILKHLFYSFQTRQIPLVVEQKGYPFAPFLFLSAIGYFLLILL